MWFQEWIKLWVKSGGMETDRKCGKNQVISVGSIVRCVALAPQCLARVPLTLSSGAGQLRQESLCLLLWAAGVISVNRDDNANARFLGCNGISSFRPSLLYHVFLSLTSDTNVLMF